MFQYLCKHTEMHTYEYLQLPMRSKLDSDLGGSKEGSFWEASI